MTFTVARASNRHNVPCDGAEKTKIAFVEKSGFKTREQFEKHLGVLRTNKWFSEGEHHRILDDGCWARDSGTQDVFTIQIDTLDELLSFTKQNGDIIVGPCMWNPAFTNITIYDDWIE